MADFKLTFGTFTLFISPFQGLRPSDQASSFDTAPQPLPRRSGSLTQIGRREPTALTVSGVVGGSTLAFTDILGVEDAIRCAMASGKQNLFFGRDDQYYRDAQCKSWSFSYDEGATHGVAPTVRLNFEASDYPEAYATFAVTPTLDTSGGVITNVGSADAQPAWTIAIATTGTGPITLTNGATGESVAIGTALTTLTSGDIYVLSREGNTVTLNGVASPASTQGRIPRLLGGADNTIVITEGGTATVATALLSYVPRYS